ncbi:LLM class flavin-dependent oxidoreductase [Streptomyces sp. NPDC002917]|uniref:LLM class flavin-dependent oxidoreductase n=1 Tax=Streptomyces sp. NPDC002917 TaxID=3364671 RepID=UPI00368CD2B0
MTDTEGLGPLGVQGRPDQAKFRDAWALMATALARTERVRMCPDVSSLPLRPPAVMAKMAASLDVMSGGRVRAGCQGRASATHQEAAGVSHPYFQAIEIANHHHRGQRVPMPKMTYEAQVYGGRRVLPWGVPRESSTRSWRSTNSSGMTA